MPATSTHRIARALSIAGLILGHSASCALAQTAPIPDFSSNNVGWQGIGNDLNAPASGPGPVTFDPRHPYVSNAEAARTGKAPNFRVADLSNPILLPATREALRRQNEEALSGAVVFTRESRCWPTGVPAFLLNPALPIYFLQTPTDVWIILEPDHRIRQVSLNRPHSPNPKPSWYGESVGHYEGDTLVVDTIGFSDRTHVDNYRTPHTTQLHVVERYRMIDGGRRLEVNILVEDPGAFTTPWRAVRRFNRLDNRPLEEVACAENNADYFNFRIDPLPMDDTPDF
jgi:hypothetical protein